MERYNQYNEPNVITSCFGIESHTLAFQALTLSLILNGKKYITLHNTIKNLPEERREQIHRIRKKHFTRKSQKQSAVQSTHEDFVIYAKELEQERSLTLTKVDTIRKRFGQQIEDSTFFGYENLASHYANRLLFLEEKGAEALQHLSKSQQHDIKDSLLTVLINRINQVRALLLYQSEWLPDLQRLVSDNKSQYQSIIVALP